MYQYHCLLSLILYSTDIFDTLYRVLSESSPAAGFFASPFGKGVFKTYLNQSFLLILYLKFMDEIHTNKDSKQSYIGLYKLKSWLCCPGHMQEHVPLQERLKLLLSPFSTNWTRATANQYQNLSSNKKQQHLPLCLRRNPSEQGNKLNFHKTFASKIRGNCKMSEALKHQDQLYIWSGWQIPEEKLYM